MSRSRRSSRDVKKRKYLISFVIGIVIGAIGLIIYSSRAPKMPAVAKIPLVSVEKEAPEAPRYKIAIVLDDFGYNYKNVEATISLTRPITFSILPNLPYSTFISRRVNQAGLEAILHLPLEPKREERTVKPELDTITVSMKSQEVLGKLNKDMATVIGIKGVSGHQGSRATENAVLMKIIFTELNNKDLFFLDSVVSNKSVCRKMAKRVGIQFAARDVFLDNKEDFEYIKGQMQHLIRRAKRYGYAIGIGHDRKETIAALSKLMPEAEHEGIEFVFVSELVK